MSGPSEMLGQIDSAVGRICSWWSALEHLVHDLVLHLAACLALDFDKAEVRLVLHAALCNMDFRQRIATAKALASQAFAVDTYSACESLLNRLDNELRSERNRCIHDLWMIDDGQLSRLKMGTVVSRPQAKKIDLRFETVTTTYSIEQLLAFVLTLESVYHDLVEIDNEAASIASRLSQIMERQR